MNKAEFINLLSEKSKLSKKDCKTCLDAVTTVVGQTLQKGENVSIIGFGKFEVKHRNARNLFNPQTKKNITIPATKVPIFKAGKSFKEAIF